MHNFLIYRASAGTGKTFSLVKEYLSVILQEPDGFRRTLAITFTNKAAEEMKSRILMHLTNIANGRDKTKKETWESMVPALMEATGMSETALVEKAAVVLGNILHNYSYFSIGTIDSFSHALVQAFAREMNLPPEFELELDSKEINPKAVDMLVDKAGEDEEITEVLVNFMKKKIGEGKGYGIKYDLNEFAEKMLKESGMSQRKKLAAFEAKDFREAERKMKTFLDDYERRISESAKPVWEKMAPIEQAFANGRNGIPSFFRKLASEPLQFFVSANAEKTIAEQKWFSGKASAAEKSIIMEMIDEAERAYHEIVDLQNKNKTKVVIYQNILKNLHATMLSNEIDRFVAEIRDSNGAVHISELNKRIAEIVDNEPVPFIYERIGSRYRNYMIDEFQDTSVLQWHNFVPLVLDALSGSGLSMIVGDGKQAIYRWRSGDVEQFERLSALTEQPPKNEAERLFKNYINLQRLDRNFRSEQEIVGFTNKLFEFSKRYIPQGYPELENVYSDLKLTALPSKSGGFVGIDFIGEEAEPSYREKTCETVLERIQELTERGFSWNDVAILCRTNRESSDVAQYLLEHQVSVASSESLLLTSSAEVNLICAALSYCAMPDAANKAIFWLQLWKTKKLPWSDAIVENINSFGRREFQNFLQKQGFLVNFDAVSRLTLYDAAVALMLAFQLNPSEDIYLRFFLDAMLEGASKNVATLNDFPAWWEEKKGKFSLIIPENTNAVQVTTIHKAKGLGFPVVIYPFADAKAQKSESAIWIDLDETEYPLPAALLSLNKNLEGTDFELYYNEEMARTALDLLNVFYVACTRPKSELHIIANSFKDSDKASVQTSIPLILRRFLEEEGVWEAEKTRYCFGAPTIKERPAAVVEMAEKSPKSSVVPWQERVAIRRYSAQNWRSKEIDYGNLVHEILEKVATPDDIGPVLKRFLDSGAFAEDDAKKIETILRNIVSHPELKHFFDAKNEILREISILLPENREIRPDRVVVEGRKAHIVDYKTGERRAEHERQLSEYAETIAQMGYDVVSAKLVYIGKEEVEVFEVG